MKTPGIRPNNRSTLHPIYRQKCGSLGGQKKTAPRPVREHQPEGLPHTSTAPKGGWWLMLPSYRTAGEDTPTYDHHRQRVTGRRAHRVAPSPLPAAPSPRRARIALWDACWQGHEPAESLPAADREDLVYYLVNAGWSDLQIALHTRMTVYTTVRIRERTGLPASTSSAHAA